VRRCPRANCRKHENKTVPSLIGSIIDGRYEVISILGTGAMGTVWLAVHLHTGHRVAVKVLERAVGAAERAYLHELRATSLADSAHTVAVLGGGAMEDGRFFIVMELVEGQSFAEVLERHKKDGVTLPYKRVAQVCAQVCAALSCAHRLGVVHQDLKPSNIMLTERDGDSWYVKVLDFGFAKLFVDGTAQTLTGRGFAAGTPAYIAPEQLEVDADLDGRADLYSLGIILFEALARRMPFDGDSPVEIARARLDRVPPSLRDLRPDLPRDLCDLVDRLLLRDASRRPKDAEEVRRALLDLRTRSEPSILDFRNGAQKPRRLSTFRRIFGLL
jgi:serine/threonine-protein kinase